MSDQVFWFATRAAGILAWFSATLSVSVGLMMSSRVLGRRPTLPWLLDVHRFLGAMSVVFLAVHLVTLWADSFVTLTVADLIVPGKAEIAGLTRMSMVWGVLAGWLLVLVQATSLIKNHLPAQFWHTLHLTSFGTVILGLVHAIQVGSDADNRILVTLAVTVLTAVTLLAATRGSRVLSERKYRYDLELSDHSVVADRAAEPTRPIQLLDDHDPGFDVEPEPVIGGAPSRVRAAPPTHRSNRGPSPSIAPEAARPVLRPGLLAESWAGAQAEPDHDHSAALWSDDDPDHDLDDPNHDLDDPDRYLAGSTGWSDDPAAHRRNGSTGRPLDHEIGEVGPGWFSSTAQVDRRR